MGQKPADKGTGEPTLELPSLFGRKNKARARTFAGDEPTTRLPAEEPAAVEPTQAPEPAPAPPLFVEDAPDAPSRDTRQAGSPPGTDEPRRTDGTGFALPPVPGRIAAIITGLVVGAFGTGLTYAGLAGCEAVKGTSSCGGPGFFLLVAILVLMVLLGILLLRAWQVSDPGSTSFLAVGVVTVVVLVALIEVIFSAWMFLVVPLVSAASYLLSHWVTTRFVDDAREGPPPHDVR